MVCVLGGGLGLSLSLSFLFANLDYEDLPYEVHHVDYGSNFFVL